MSSLEGVHGAVTGQRPSAEAFRVAHGLYGASDAPSDVLRAWQLLLPTDGRFTHLTAAAIRDWWLPPRPTGLPVFVAMGRTGSRPLRAGIKTIRSPHLASPDVIDGVRVASAVETLFACARDLGLLDLVVLIDCALHTKAIDLETLTVAARTRRRGAPALRAALPWADARSESAWETLLRILHVICDIEVQPQFELRAGDRLVARGDLWLVGTKRFHEYDGGHHLERRQQAKDLRRQRALDESAWSRHGYVSDDLLHRAVGILRDADRALGREHQPGRVHAWYDLLRDSCFTPAGQRRLLTKLGVASGC